MVAVETGPPYYPFCTGSNPAKDIVHSSVRNTLYCNGHINVTDAARVKSSKVETILPWDHHAKLHVIKGTVASHHWEVRARVARGE